MSDDIELLRCYAEEKSGPAFESLVKRHLPLVYGAALRQLGGDEHGAKDVAQTVFTDLARKAPTLVKRSLLVNWLYTSTRYTAAKLRRSRARRWKYEVAAGTMNPFNEEQEMPVDWGRVRPLIDEVMQELNERDRTLVLLRYFENRSFVEIGSLCGLSADAARVRVDRSFEKLRTLLGRRGVTSTGLALAAMLADQVTAAVPSAWVAAISQAAVAGAAASPAAGLLTFMTTNKAVALCTALAALSFITASHQATSTRDIARQLATEQREVDTAREAMSSVRQKIASAEKDVTNLKQTLDRQRSAEAPLVSSSSSSIANKLRTERDAVAAGDAFLVEHPDVKRAIVERGRARIASKYYLLYAELHLTPLQIDQFETLMLENEGITMNDPQTGNLRLRAGVGLSPAEIEKGLRDLLGVEGYNHFRESSSVIVAAALTTALGSSLFFTAEPLTPTQAQQLNEVVTRLDKAAGKNRGSVPDWSGLMSEAASVLSPNQLAALGELQAQQDFSMALKQAMSVPKS